MYAAAAEETGKNLINGRGDAYCGMLNCSYNLGLRKLKAYIPSYPVGTAEEVAKMIADFQPMARTLIGLSQLKIITFGPRPQDFFACNAPIKPLYDLGIEIEENSELDLLVSYQAHKDDPRIADVVADMTEELGKDGNPWPDLLPRMAQYELTLLDWAEAHKGSRQYVAFANKCWPASRPSSALNRATSTAASYPAASPSPVKSTSTAPSANTSACAPAAIQSPCSTLTTPSPVISTNRISNRRRTIRRKIPSWASTAATPRCAN